jgi:inorganic pyrophosphatase
MSVESLRAVRHDGYLNVVVETPRGSTIKIKFDPASGLMMLSRPLPSGLSYPFDWGFVAGTRAADGDPLDALVLWDCSSYPGLLVPSRPLALLAVEQSAPDGMRQRNDRLVVVPGKSPRLDALQSLDDIPVRLRAELEQFFIAAVAFEGKHVRLLGWQGSAEARRLVESSVS